MIGSPLARAVEAPGGGFHWGSEAWHHKLPRGQRIRIGTAGTLQEILFGPSRHRRRHDEPRSARCAGRWPPPATPSSRSSSVSRSSSSRLTDHPWQPRAPPALPRRARTPRAAELDVLVVGGGLVGAGVALDAVTRGLGCGLLEQRDLASGTSSRSSKLIHGGLRYLEMFDFALVREALQERGLMLTRLAPHLVRPVPFLYPLDLPLGAAVRRRRAGALRRMADRRGAAGVPAHRHLIRRQALPGRPRPPPGRADRRGAVPRLPGRRRPAHDDARPDRRPPRRPRRHADPGDRLPAGG